MIKNSYILYFSLILILSGCSSVDNNIERSDIYFKKGLKHYENKKYSKSKDRFQQIIDNYSGTEIAVDALYYLALCEYELKDFQNSKQSFSIYTRYSQDIIKAQFARFMICKCMFESTLDYPNDQTETVTALNEFQLFIEDYPSSKYNEEAMDKILFLRSKLSLKQYEIAKLYIKTEKYEAAKLYLDELLKLYYDTESADDARIGYVIIYLMNNDITGAENFLDKNKSKFNKNQNYLDALSLVENSKKKIKVKGLYILDYIKKIL